MIRRLRGLLPAVVLLLLSGAGSALAEPQFLAKQYSRCTTCHYSPTGGGLLTPYGRALSKLEISSFGAPSDDGAEDEEGRWHEERFLYGLLGDALGPVSLGVDLRPSRLRFETEGFEETRDFWMRADLQVGFRHEGWSAYAELGRLPTSDPEFISREHWVSYEFEDGMGIRVGRFLPAFGIRLSDHTAFTRRDLGFDQDDQVYGVELSDTGERSLLQIQLGPGRAESIVDDDGRASFTGSIRYQRDLTSRQVLVLSGMARAATDFSSSVYLGGLAYGWAPTPRLAIWTELDALFTKGWEGTPQYAIYNETSYEVVKGLWLKFSPQLLTELNNVSGGSSRISLGAQWLPRTHWNLNVAWHRERNRVTGDVFTTLVLQLHLYL